VFNLQPARFVADKNPLPLGSLARRALDQLLVHQPRFDRAEVTQTRSRNLRNFWRDFHYAFANTSPMIVIHALLEQVRTFTSTRGFGKEFAARVKDKVGGVDGLFVEAPYQ